ncbi:MAG: PKD domain-containing protein, partial [Candidatus Bipolaricaulota bacterium]
APDTVTTGTYPYIPFYGTSGAAPHAAGAAALLLSETPGLTGSGLRSRLLASVIPGGDPYAYGQGRLQLTLAVIPNQAPTAAYTFVPTSPTAGQTISFDGSLSSDPDGTVTSWEWSFGDGQSGTGQHASHSYVGAGTYTVTLLVRDDDGATDSETKQVTVGAVPNQAPTAAYVVAPPNPVVGQTVAFDGSSSHDTDGVITSWEWSFGDGQVASGSQTTHSYGSAGIYSVTLVVRDDDGATDSETKQLTVTAAPNQPPTAVFPVTPTAPEVGETVTFDGSASSDADGYPVNWQWSFGDGQSASGVQVTHTYAAAGTYSVTLVVHDDDGATDAETQQIAVAAPALPDLVVTNIATSPQQPTIGDTITFQVTLANQGAADAGLFRVRLDGASSSTGGYLWGLAAGASQTVTLSRTLTQSVETFTVTVDDQGQVSESNEGNNVAQETITAVVAAPVADAGGPYSGTVGQPVAFDGSASTGTITTYSWSFGDGGTAQGATPTHSYSGSGTYTAILTVTGPGGQSSDSAPVTVSAAQPPLAVQLSLPKPSYESGEPIIITYAINRPAYVYICDVDATGVVRLVFPNYREPNNQLAAGTYTLPGAPGYSIVVGPPTGTETLYAFAATGPLSAFPTSYGSGFPVLSYDPSGFRSAVLQAMQAQYPSGERADDVLSFSVTSPPPTTGTLLLSSNPLGAAITVDGVPMGVTSAQLTLSAGSHSVTLSLPGHQTESFAVVITAGQTTSRSVTLTPLVSNQDPVADFSYSPPGPTVGQSVSFDASSSDDPDGSIMSYAWNFGDGGSGSGVSTTHTYTSSGTRTVTLTVTDTEGATDSHSATISVSTVSVPEPRGHWRFNEGGGSTASDSSANGNHGSLVGPSWATSADGSGALGFDGVDDIVRILASTSLNSFGTKLTLEAWIQPSALGGTQRILSQDGSGSNDNRFFLSTEGNFVSASVYTGTWVTVIGDYRATIYNGIWYHVAAVYDGRLLALYLNGDRIAITYASGIVGEGQGAVMTTIGGKEDGTQMFAGLIDEVHVHGVNVRPTSFTRLPASYVPPSPTNQPPVADFTFSPENPKVGDLVRFDSSASYDPEDGANLSKRWHFSDGATASGGSPRRTWDQAGTYTVTLTVWDTGGLETSITKEVTVSP